MAGLLSPRPVSYLQQQQHNPPYANHYNRSALSYSESPGPLAHSVPQQPGQQFLTAVNGASGNGLNVQDESKIFSLVIDLMDPSSRETALLELSKKREQYDDLALILWHSFGESKAFLMLLKYELNFFLGIMPALLQEIVSVYPLLSPPNLTAHVSNRVCNALALLQCVASHTETRQLFLNGWCTVFCLIQFANSTFQLTSLSSCIPS